MDSWGYPSDPWPLFIEHDPVSLDIEHNPVMLPVPDRDP